MDIDIAIKNYRCFQQPARISLRKGFTGFVGINNSGKSSLLKFFCEFRHLFDLLANPGQLVSAFGNRGPNVNLRYVLEAEEVFCNGNENDIGDRKKPGEMQVRHLFFVDGCSLNRRPLRIIKSLGVKDLARVVSHRADSAGLPLSPPVFFGLTAV